MKKNLLVTAALVLVLTTTGCVSAIVRDVNPRVIGSSIDTAVSQNELRKEMAETGKANEKLNQEMTVEYKKVAIAEIQGKTGVAETGNKPLVTISKNGVLGGFETIFINDSTRKKTIIAEKIGGFMNRQKFGIPLEKNTRTVIKLPTGYYHLTWVVENINTTFPENGPDRFEVTAAPHYYDYESDKNYHGGYKLFGY